MPILLALRLILRYALHKVSYSIHMSDGQKYWLTYLVTA